MNITSVQGTMPNMQQTGNTQEPFSETQKAEVASILADYNVSTLNEEDALAINDAFREAGFKRGPELRNAIEEAGFDAEQLGSLAPPPPTGPPPGGKPAAIDVEALTELQEILADYDLSNLTSDQEDEIANRIQSSGIEMKGLLVDQQA